MGTLTNDGVPVPNSPLRISSARYVVSGEQSYSPDKRAWVSGQLTIDVSYDMTSGGKPSGSAKGTMIVTLEKLTEKK